jgi:hypothetical protein
MRTIGVLIAVLVLLAVMGVVRGYRRLCHAINEVFPC